MSENADDRVPPGGLIVELGSNDGTALASVRRRDVRVLGIDPARNVAVMAAARGVPTVSEFFTESLGQEVARVAGPASLVVACNVLGHIDDLDDVCRGVSAMLSPTGALVFEVPYLRQLFDRCEYDTVYHEHLSYFAVRPLAVLFNRHGLRLEKIESFAVHGGTIRGTVVRGKGMSDAVRAMVDDETAAGMASPQTWRIFSQRAQDQKESLLQRLSQLRQGGKRVIGYGAPAKGTVILNHCGIGTDLVDSVIDSTPAKQGLYIPGTHQKILPPEHLQQEHPDVALLLAWNHAEEITRREAAFIRDGGSFLLPHAATA
jgi:novobiocin biosynthesis protein NovU/D-mycarose 3-C-methyltransferase